MEQRQQNANPNNPTQKENPHTLYNLFSKTNKNETQTFGNYCVNFNEMFPKEEETKDYFKNHVSLFNDDPVTNEKIMGASPNFILPKYFDKLEEKTLFYIFYFMSRDTLQLFAGYNLYKKGWLYNYKNQIWFKNNKESEKWIYFNPLEWKKNEFVFGPVDTNHFLPEEEVKSYLKQLEKEKSKENKKKQGHKSGNNNHVNNSQNAQMNNNINNSGNNNPNNNQKNEQKNNNA